MSDKLRVMHLTIPFFSPQRMPFNFQEFGVCTLLTPLTSPPFIGGSAYLHIFPPHIEVHSHQYSLAQPIFVFHQMIVYAATVHLMSAHLSKVVHVLHGPLYYLWSPLHHLLGLLVFLSNFLSLNSWLPLCTSSNLIPSKGYYLMFFITLQFFSLFFLV